MYNVIGWIGMILFLVNYALVAFKKLKTTDNWYHSAQIIAAVAIAYSLVPVKETAWATIALEGFFVIIGIVAIIRKVAEKKTADTYSS